MGDRSTALKSYFLEFDTLANVISINNVPLNVECFLEFTKFICYVLSKRKVSGNNCVLCLQDISPK